MGPPAYTPVPLSTIDEEKVMSASYESADKEPLLPTAADEGHGCPMSRRGAQRSKSLIALFVAVRLAMLAFLGVFAHRYFTGQSIYKDMIPSQAYRTGEWHPHVPHRVPGHNDHHGPPGPPPPPIAIECFDILAEDAAVNTTLTLIDAAAPVFLMPDLAEAADVAIVRTEKTQDGLPHMPGVPSHIPRPGPPHHPRPQPHMPCHRPTTIMVQVSRDDEKVEGGSEDGVFFCSLRLPAGQRGLGLFAHDMTKEPEHHGEKPHPPHKHNFPHVDLTINVPAGQPFTVTSAPPAPPQPPKHEPWWRWGRPSPPHGPPPHDGPGAPPHPPAGTIVSKADMIKAAQDAAKDRHDKAHGDAHVVVVTITRMFRTVRKSFGCGARKLMGKH